MTIIYRGMWIMKKKIQDKNCKHLYVVDTTNSEIPTGVFQAAGTIKTYSIAVRIRCKLCDRLAFPVMKFTSDSPIDKEAYWNEEDLKAFTI